MEVVGFQCKCDHDEVTVTISEKFVGSVTGYDAMASTAPLWKAAHVEHNSHRMNLFVDQESLATLNV